jgi:class 3 adenylate cyclase/DNA-binding response OmpR family regulator
MTPDTADWREELRRDYLRTLPDKLDTLRRQLEALVASPGEAAAREVLLGSLHRLHGSAGSYGFADVGRLAGVWELELVRGARPVTPTALQHMRSWLASMQRQLEPVHDAPLTPPPSEALVAGIRAALGRDPRVLVVEDDPDLAAFVVRTLESLAIGCVALGNPTEALALLRRENFDLLVCDYRFPEGTAKGLVHDLRELDPEAPILVISGQVDKRELLDIIRESVYEFQEKPLEAGTLVACVARLLVLGEERRRTRRRGAALLTISSQVKLGMAGQDVLGILAQAVPEITPFRSASVLLLDEATRRLRLAAGHGSSPSTWPDGLTLAEAQAHHARGTRLDVAAFVSVGGGRHAPWREGDQVLVELRSGERLWGYLMVTAPLDGRRPSDDSLRMLSLLGHQMASALENEDVYATQMRLNFQLRFARELVRTALGTAEVETLKPMLTNAAVGGLGGSFACFLERTPRGWRLSDIACKRTEDYLENLAVTPGAEAALARLERGMQPFHWRAQDGAFSMVGRRRSQAVLALPVRAHDTLSHVLLVEDDERGEFDEASLRAYQGLSEQVGLILSRLHYQRYLETTSTELQESYAKLQAAHADNVRLQGLLKRYLPASTWESLLQSSRQPRQEPIEATLEAAVMFVDLAGFGALCETLSMAAQIELLNVFFSSVSELVIEQQGEVIKYLGDGIMAHFATRAAALRAARTVLLATPTLSAGLRERGLPAVMLRLGASWGPIVIGHVGPHDLTERTLLGAAVHTAALLQRAAEPGGLLLDRNLLPRGERPEAYGLTPLPDVVLPGRERPLAVLGLQAVGVAL